MSAQRFGAHGWPLVPSTRWPGENALACPDCGSTRVVLYGIPGWDGRMGSPGTGNGIRCKDCGKRDEETR